MSYCPVSVGTMSEKDFRSGDGKAFLYILNFVHKHYIWEVAFNEVNLFVDICYIKL